MPLQVRLAARAGCMDKLVSAVAGDRRRFPNVREVVRCRTIGGAKPYAIVTYRRGYAPSDAATAGIIQRYMDLWLVEEAMLIGTPGEFESTEFGNALRLFLSADSILAEGGSSALRQVSRTLWKIKRDGHRIYLVSSRHPEQVMADIDALAAEPFGIAENGGVMVLPSHETVTLGDRTEPDKVLHYMKVNCRRVVEDVSQAMRRTERIFRRDVPEPRFREYVRRSRADVEVVSTRTAYHVAKRGVDKGSGLEGLRARLELGKYDIVVGVGDSDLDAPMLEKSDWSFAVHNASRRAKRAATASLGGSYGDGVAEMYDRWM